MKFRIKGKLILVGISSSLVTITSYAQVATRGLSPASNTYRSFQDGSVARDSGLNQPLDLLNDFYPAIEVTIADHDNVRRRPGQDEDDLKITVLPSLAYRTNIGRHQFYAAYSGTFTFHDELSQEDAESNNVSAKLGLDINRSWDLDLFASAGQTFEQRGVSGTRPFNTAFIGGRDNGPDRVEYGAYGADLIYGRKLNKLTAVAGFERISTGFEADESGGSIGAIQGGNRDRDTDSIHFDVNYRIGDKTSIFGRVQYSDVDYDRIFNSLDSEQTDFLVGVRWKPTGDLSGVVGVGRTDKNFDDPERNGFDGNSYYANVNYSINPFSIINFSASRLVEEPSDEESSFYESELFGVSWDHSITSHLVFNAYSKWIDDDYDTGREDQFVDWGVGLDYAWRSWLTAGIYYGEIERESTREGVAFDDSFFGVRFRSDLRSLLRKRSKDRREPASFGSLEKTKAAQ